MGLDAVVCCDCVEAGRLRIPHPSPRLLYIAKNGSPEIRSEDPDEVSRHDAWMHTACKHEEMMIAGAYLGNATAIAFLQQALLEKVGSPAREFPVLWKEVIYDGTHCGHLTLNNVRRLDEELRQFGKVRFGGLPAAELRLVNFARI